MAEKNGGEFGEEITQDGDNKEWLTWDQMNKINPEDLPFNKLKEYPDFKEEGGTVFADGSYWHLKERVIDRPMGVSEKKWARIDEAAKEQMLHTNQDSAYLWTPNWKKENQEK